jgi:hypothetical protein
LMRRMGLEGGQGVGGCARWPPTRPLPGAPASMPGLVAWVHRHFKIPPHSLAPGSPGPWGYGLGTCGFYGFYGFGRWICSRALPFRCIHPSCTSRRTGLVRLLSGLVWHICMEYICRLVKECTVVNDIGRRASL